MGVRGLCRVAVVAVVAAAGLVPGAARAEDDDTQLSLVVPILAPMLPGQQGWVSAMWLAGRDVCDVQVTAAGAGLTIGYPTNTGTYASFYVNSALAEGNRDYTALNVAVGATVRGPVRVTLTASYRRLPPGLIKKADDLATKKFVCAGQKASRSVEAALPVIPSTGAAVVQKTTAVSIPKSTPTWAEVTFRGMKPNLANFRVTLSPPQGLTVTYPGEGTSAGLAGVATLPVGQDDKVAFRLDAAGLAPGNYMVPVQATYTGGSFTGQLTVTVT
jgi:hypothetical protein